jgi:fructose-1,6-bisphosphatase/inositol monophosphatase family enzyme
VRLVDVVQRLLADAWLAACHTASVEVRALVAATPTPDRHASTGAAGAGGDVSLALDVAAERIVLEGLSGVARAHELNSWAETEEAGRVSLSPVRDGPAQVVSIDPIDGSRNVGAGVPIGALSVAVSASGQMEDVELGFVADLFRKVEYWAWCDEAGLFTVSESLQACSRRADLEVVAVEHAPPEDLAALLPALPQTVRYVRVPGAAALSLALVAAGGFDGVVAAKPLRPFDVAAGQFLVRAVGGSVYLGDSDPGLSAHTRLPLVAAATINWLEMLRPAGGVASSRASNRERSLG